MTENNELALAKPASTHFESIPLKLIDDPQRPMRSDLSHESIDELVSSIRQVGMIEPVVVKVVGDRYEVIAGHRRTVAAETAGLETIPCHVVDATEEQVEMMKIHENLMRVDVNPYDEAQHYARLMREMKLSPMRIARLTNRSEGYVRDRLVILDYAPELQEAVAVGKLRLGVAKELAKLKDPAKQREMMGYAIGHGITAAVAKKWVDESQPQPDRPGDSNSFIGDLGNVVPASEQHSECFYCLKEVRLQEAYTVFVHDECLKQRQADAQPDTEQEAE